VVPKEQYTIITPIQKAPQNTLRQPILVITQKAAVMIEIIRHPITIEEIEKVQLKQKDLLKKVLEEHSLLQITVINQTTAEIATKTEVVHQVIVAKIEDDLVTDASKIIVETEPQQIVHTDHIHQETTDTSHLKTDINHHDEMIATNHPEETLDTNHLDEIQDINHPDVILTDRPIETIDPLNIAHIPPITVRAKMIITHQEEITRVHITDHHQQIVDNSINPVQIDSNHLTGHDHHINNKATDTAPPHLIDNQTIIKIIQETVDRDLPIAQTTDRDREAQEQDHFME